MITDDKATGRVRVSSRARLMMTGALLFLVAVFLALGAWQVQRLFW